MRLMTTPPQKKRLHTSWNSGDFISHQTSLEKYTQRNWLCWLGTRIYLARLNTTRRSSVGYAVCETGLWLMREHIPIIRARREVAPSSKKNKKKRHLFVLLCGQRNLE